MPADEEWIGLHQASAEADIPVTTLRDWYRSGAIESISDSDGRRLVLLSEVLREATGRDPRRRKQARPVKTSEELERETESIAARTRAVNELQDIARQRLQDPPRD